MVACGIAGGVGPDCETTGVFVIAPASPPTAPELAYDLEFLAGVPVSEYVFFRIGGRTVGPGCLTVRPAVPWGVVVACVVLVERCAAALEPPLPEPPPGTDGAG